MNIKLKKLVALIVLVLLLTGGTAFGYWATNFLGDTGGSTGSVIIGEGEEVETVLKVSGSSKETLVPDGYHDGVDTFHYVELEFTVIWEIETYDDIEGWLEVEILSYTLGDLLESEIDDMFSIEIIQGEGVINSNEVHIVLIGVNFHTVPFNSSVYNQVANNILEIQVEMEVQSLE